MDGQKVIECLSETLSYLYVHNYDTSKICKVLDELRKEYGLTWADRNRDGTEASSSYRGILLYKKDQLITAYFGRTPQAPFFTVESEKEAIDIIDLYHINWENCSNKAVSCGTRQFFEINEWLFMVDLDMKFKPYLRHFRYMSTPDQ